MEQLTEELRSEAADLVRAARIYASGQAAWFAPAFYAAPLVLTEQMPYVAGIDRHGRVYFNPRWMLKLRELCEGDHQRLLRQVAFIWYHEISHWLREHAQRAEEMDAQPFVWNLATDMEINDEVPDGLELARHAGVLEPVLPSSHNLPDGQIGEWYYRRLLEKALTHPDSASPAAMGDDTSPQPSSLEDSANAQRLRADLLDGGSGIHGQPQPWELCTGNPAAPALNDFDRQSLRAQVAQRILDEHQEGRSTAPAGWVRWAQEVVKPKVSWRERLKRAVRGAINQGFGQRLDYSLRRPNRRASVYHPFHLPSLQGEYKPRVVCVVDTSGSIGEKELAQAMAEVRGVLEQLRVPITLIPCDAVPYEAVQVLTNSDWVKAAQALKGGGGTDMVAGLSHALETKPPPDAVIVLTDGYTPFRSERPRQTQVIWAIWKLGDNEPPMPGMPPWKQRDVVIVPVGSDKSHVRR